MRFRIAGPYFRCAVIHGKSFALYVNSEADEKVFDAMLLFPYMPPHIQWIGERATTPQISGIREAQSNTSSAPFEMPYMIIFSYPLFFSHRIAVSNGSTGTRTSSIGSPSTFQ